MTQRRRLTQATLQQIELLEERIDVLEREGRLDAPSPTEAAEVRSAVNAVLSEFTEVSRFGNPTNPIDRSLVNLLKVNREAVQADIAALRAAGEPSPVDYYEIAYKVMSDSGLVGQAVLEPDLVRRLVARTIGTASFFEFNTLAIGGCDFCGACGACGLCGACGACPLTGAVGTGGALATAGTGGAVGWFF
jgi:hypothetical protein